MSDSIGAARRRQLRCRKWISIVVLWCSYTPATEAVLPSIHYTRSVPAPRFTATMGHYLLDSLVVNKLFNESWICVSQVRRNSNALMTGHSIVRRTTTHYNTRTTLQHTVTYCNALQHTAIHCDSV